MIKFADLLNFAITSGKLKKLKRSGWVRHKIKDSESVADHSFRTAILAFILAKDFSLNREKVICMSLIHDLAESEIGDITPNDNVSNEEKHRMEAKAMRKICSSIPNGNEIISLFEEFEEGETAEAKFVKIVDKFEMMIQSYEYGIAQPNIDLKEFWDFGEKQDFGVLYDKFNSLKQLRNK